MGRIKSTMVKKAAKQLLETEHFNTDFDHNKRLLQGHMPSKPIRNKVAGYIARLTKMKMTAKRVPKKVIEPQE
ncbi:30S ribosomal protein S17e [Candidatus Pacearchaeota archaeon]|nr:30S ribosomal protein S17e [Candidatus Pacearchaeota archaeon]